MTNYFQGFFFLDVVEVTGKSDVVHNFYVLKTKNHPTFYELNTSNIVIHIIRNRKTLFSHNYMKLLYELLLYYMK